MAVNSPVLQKRSSQSLENMFTHLPPAGIVTQTCTAVVDAAAKLHLAVNDAHIDKETESFTLSSAVIKFDANVLAAAVSMDYDVLEVGDKLDSKTQRRQDRSIRCSVLCPSKIQAKTPQHV